MNWLAKSAHLAYFPTKDKPLNDRWTRLRGVAEVVGLSSKGKEKLEWMIFYYSYGKMNAKLTAGYFGISRKTFHKWLKRYDEKKLLTLEEKSKSPNQKRSWEVTFEEERRVINLRKKYLHYGKKKIKILYLKTYQESISTWKIERVVRKWKLYPDLETHFKRLKIKAKRAKKTSIRSLERKDQFGFLWHIDAIIIWWYGSKRVVFTAMEEVTKIAFARVYKTNSSGFAKDFLERLIYLMERWKSSIQTMVVSLQDTFRKPAPNYQFSKSIPDLTPPKTILP